MKTFLAFLISCLTLSAATTYPVLTDSTNRLFLGGVTNVFFLNSNVVTTGTMRATGALTLTNSGNVFAGDGSGLTGISAGISKTNGSATNLSLYSSGTTNRPFRVFGTNGTTESYFDKDGKLVLGNAGTWPSTPGLTFVADTTSGFGLSAAGYPAMYASTAADVLAGGTIVTRSDSTKVAVNGLVVLGFTGAGFAIDSAFYRNSAGLIEVNNGASGAFRDLLARSLYATNIYATNLIVNAGATVTGILSATATLDFNLTAVDVEDLTITVTGAAVGNVVALGVPHGSVTATAQFTGWVSAADTVTVRCRVAPAAAENPASGTFRATVIKH